MKRLLLLSTLCIISLFYFHKVHSALYLGAEIAWEHYQADTFMINLSATVDCNGIANYKTAFDVVNLCNNGSSYITCNYTTRDVTPVCKEACTRCSDPSCTDTRFGITAIDFSSKVKLDTSKCCKWKIVWQASHRPSALTNAGADEYIYVDAWLDACTEMPNNFPGFKEPPLTVVCKDRCISYNPAPINNDTNATGRKDSLHFKLVNALKAAGTAVTYTTGYSATVPFTYSTNTAGCSGFNLDAATGDLKFLPTKAENGIIAIQVQKYRKDKNGTAVLIGETRRDMAVYVTDECNSNSVPSFMPTQDTFYICAGVSNCFDHITVDYDFSDTVHISANHDMAGATVSITKSKRSTATLYWKPEAKDIRNTPYTLTLKAYDNACPYPAWGQKIYYFFVTGLSNEPVIKVDTLSGDREYRFSLEDTTSITGYEWYFLDTDSTLTDAAPVYKFAHDGRYPISLTAYHKSGCIIKKNHVLQVEICEPNAAPVLSTSLSSDSVYICAHEDLCFNVTTSDGDAGDSVKLGFSDILGGNNYTVDNTKVFASASFCWKPDTSYVPNAPYDFWITARDNRSSGCDEATTKRIRVFVTPAANAKFKVVRDPFTDLKYNFYPDDLGFNAYEWDFGDSQTSTAIKPSHIYAAEGKYTVTLTVEGAAGCKVTETLTLDVKGCQSNKAPEISTGNGTYTYTICAGDSVCIDILTKDDSSDVTDIIYTTDIKGAKYTEDNTQRFAKAQFCWKPLVSDIRANPYRISVTASDNNNLCKGIGKDTIWVYVEKANSSFTPHGTGLREYLFVPQDTGALQYTWDFGDGMTSSDKRPSHTYSADGAYTVELKLENATGCEGVTIMQLSVYATAIGQNVEESEWRVYPNPVKGDKLTIEASNPLSGSVKVILLDINGRAVVEMNQVMEQRIEVKLPEGLTPGAYMLRILGDKAYQRTVMIK